MPNLISCRTMYLFLKLDYFVMEKIELFRHDLAGFRVALSFFSLLSYFSLTKYNFAYTMLFSTNFSTDFMSWLIDNQYFKSGIWSEATDTKHNRSTLAPFFRSRLAALILVMGSLASRMTKMKILSSAAISSRHSISFVFFFSRLF